MATVRFRAQAVRHTRALMVWGIGALFVATLAWLGLLAMGAYTLGLAVLALAVAGLVGFGWSVHRDLRATPHVLRVGRVERPRAEWGRFEVRQTNQEVVLSHHRDHHPREWWSVLPEHADRVRWFIQQVQAMQTADAGDEQAVPHGLRRMTARTQPE